MYGKISSMELINTESGCFWQLTIVDENGFEIGTFGTPDKSDSISFRKQTFGIMHACGCWDLLSISGKKISFPILVEEDPIRLNTICNADGEFISIDLDGTVRYGENYDISNCEERTLTSLESSSGILSAETTTKYTRQHFQSPNSYIGFNELYAQQTSKELEQKGANSFKNFVCQILHLGKISNLFKDNCDFHTYPTVSIILDKDNNIKAIGDINERAWLINNDEGYSISKTPPIIVNKKI